MEEKSRGLEEIGSKHCKVKEKASFFIYVSYRVFVMLFGMNNNYIPIPILDPLFGRVY
jgi:hypothetical protein